MSAAPGVIKCRFCDFKTKTAWTSKTGKLRDGWRYLANHIEAEHPDQAHAIEEELGLEEPE